MEFGLGRVDSRERATVVISSDTLSEVVSLDLATSGSKVISRPLPINFVLII
jgi:hypothetical protein